MFCCYAGGLTGALVYGPSWTICFLIWKTIWVPLEFGNLGVSQQGESLPVILRHIGMGLSFRLDRQGLSMSVFFWGCGPAQDVLMSIAHIPTPGPKHICSPLCLHCPIQTCSNLCEVISVICAVISVYDEHLFAERTGPRPCYGAQSMSRKKSNWTFWTQTFKK